MVGAFHNRISNKLRIAERGVKQLVCIVLVDGKLTIIILQWPVPADQFLDNGDILG